MQTQVLYKAIADAIQARRNCEKTGNDEWFEKWTDTLREIEKQHLPSGSGIDSGCTIDMENSTDNRIVINSSYHAMNENGYYDGWYDFRVVVTPSLAFDIDIKIVGRFGRYQDIREYLHEEFSTILMAVV